LRLYIVRHAIAEERNEWEGDDASRPLTDLGIERMQLAVKGLHSIVDDLGVIITSPYVRAQQTAELLQAQFSKSKLVESKLLVPSSTPSKVTSLISELGEETLTLVSHEPLCSSFLERASAGRVMFKKGAVAALEGGSEYLVLRFLLQPRLLRQLGSK